MRRFQAAVFAFFGTVWHMHIRFSALSISTNPTDKLYVYRMWYFSVLLLLLLFFRIASFKGLQSNWFQSIFLKTYSQLLLKSLKSYVYIYYRIILLSLEKRTSMGFGEICWYSFIRKTVQLFLYLNSIWKPANNKNLQFLLHAHLTCFSFASANSHLFSFRIFIACWIFKPNLQA